MPNELDKVLQRLNRQIGQKVKDGERSVAKQFVQVLAEIRALLAKMFEKYEVNGKLTWEQLAKYDRFNKMMGEVNFIIKTHYSGLYKIITSILGDLYQDGYYMTAYGVEKEARVKLSYSTVRPEVITVSAINPITKLSPRLWAEFEHSTLIQKMQQTITRGLVEGSTYSNMAKNLKNDLGVSTYKAMRVVRTEGHRVSESAKFDAANYADQHGIVTMKRWNSLKDERVRQQPKDAADHRNLDGKTIRMDETFFDGLSKGLSPGSLPAPASSINCRCFLTYEVVDIQRKQHDELANITFDEWKKTRLKQ